MKFKVTGRRIVHFETEISANSYKELQSKLDEKETQSFGVTHGETSLDYVVRVKDGRTWEDGVLTHTSEGVKSPNQRRYERMLNYEKFHNRLD